MIFVILGTQKFQFNRLLKQVDKIANEKNEFFAQIGNSDYCPINYPFCKFLDKEKFEEYIEKCELVITHSGVGSIINALKKEKPVIVVPRKSEFGEHIDDHQIDIAEAFSYKKYVLYCEDIENLENDIEKARGVRFEEYRSGRKNIINIIENYIDKI